MRKFLAFAIGLGLVLGTVSYAQDKSDDTSKTKKSKKKKKSDKTDSTDKKM